MNISADATIGFLNRQKIRCIAAPSTNKCVAAAILASIFFFLAGQPFIPQLGIQNDEALFAGAIYEPLEALYAWPLPHHQQIPLMLMTYLGCLKTLIYLPIFKLFGNGVYAVREPALIFGAASVWLFFLLLRRIAGNRAGLVGCWLAGGGFTLSPDHLLRLGPGCAAASAHRGRRLVACAVLPDQVKRFARSRLPSSSASLYGIKHWRSGC